MLLRTLLTATCLIALAGCASTNTTSAPTVTSDQTASAAQAFSTSSAAPALLPNQPGFNSQQEALDALRKAAAAKDRRETARILGLPEEDLDTGNPDNNTQHADALAKATAEFIRAVPESDDRARVFVGKNNYPLPSPLVRVNNRWFFDSAGGRQELLARAVGENELATINVCRTYVQAQYEYYSEDRNGDDVLQYAQQLGSTKGTHDGLYWHAEGDEPDSPLGSLIAGARATGYLRGSVRQLNEPKPYHGYLFQILTAQGESAPGGKYSYIINNRMVAGFALVAYPAKWGKTGVMTFLVGANGKVYQKDLGEHTADTMTEYNPDSTWTLVQD